VDPFLTRTRYDPSVFPYDSEIVEAVSTPPATIADVIRIMQTIECLCAAGDGLKWFNWLYRQVTEAVQTRASAGGFTDPTWIAELDYTSPDSISPPCAPAGSVAPRRTAGTRF